MVAVSSLLFSLPTLTLTCSSTPETPPHIHWLILPFPEAWEVFEMSYAPLETAYVFCYSYSMLFVSLSSRQRPCTGRLDWTRRRWRRRCAGARRRICWVLRRVTPTSSLRFTTLLPVVTTHWASRKVWLSKRDEWLRNMRCLISPNPLTVQSPPLYTDDKPHCIDSVNSSETQDQF